MRLVEDAMMRIVLKRIAKDIKDFRLAFVLFAAYNIMVRKLFHAFCPQLILTGFPCAGCGLTRAVFHILTGNFERGIRLNPAAVFWILFFAWFFWNRYVLGKTKQTAKYWLGPRLSRSRGSSRRSYRKGKRDYARPDAERREE